MGFSPSGRLVLIGAQGGTNIGQSFLKAAKELNLKVDFFDVQKAFQAPRLINAVYRKFGGQRPLRLREFSKQVTEDCRKDPPRWLLSTGIAPLDDEALKTIGQIGVKRLNYLTDDPWNPHFRTAWFFEALKSYDHVFSVRRSNLDDLSRQGCRSVEYLPFGYDPNLFYPEEPPAGEKEKLSSDILFAGGADADRVPYITALIRGKFRLALYGGYWERYPETRPHGRGLADSRILRQALGQAKTALCLVRRANRDGHAMRTFEIPAVGACMLAEDTSEHRDIFGEDGRTVSYFKNQSEMVEKLRWLLDRDEERHRLGKAAQRIILDGRNTYKDRLRFILGIS